MPGDRVTHDPPGDRPAIPPPLLPALADSSGEKAAKDFLRKRREDLRVRHPCWRDKGGRDPLWRRRDTLGTYEITSVFLRGKIIVERAASPYNVAGESRKSLALGFRIYHSRGGRPLSVDKYLFA